MPCLESLQYHDTMCLKSFFQVDLLLKILLYFAFESNLWKFSLKSWLKYVSNYHSIEASLKRNASNDLNYVVLKVSKYRLNC